MQEQKPKLKERLKALINKTSQVYIAMKSKQTPWYAKMVGYITVGYFLSPIDIIPDFIPVLGYLDDLIIIPALVALFIKLVPKEVWNASEEEAKSLWKNGKPKRWYYAIPIVLLWGVIVYFVLNAILS